MSTEEIRATGQLARVLRALWLARTYEAYAPPYVPAFDGIDGTWCVRPKADEADGEWSCVTCCLESEAQAIELAEALNAPAVAAALREDQP